jgi:hypothetical protein
VWCGRRGEVFEDNFLKFSDQELVEAAKEGCEYVRGFNGNAAEMVGHVHAARDGGVAATTHRYDCWMRRV